MSDQSCFNISNDDGRTLASSTEVPTHKESSSKPTTIPESPESPEQSRSTTEQHNNQKNTTTEDKTTQTDSPSLHRCGKRSANIRVVSMPGSKVKILTNCSVDMESEDSPDECEIDSSDEDELPELPAAFSKASAYTVRKNDSRRVVSYTSYNTDLKAAKNARYAQHFGDVKVLKVSYGISKDKGKLAIVTVQKSDALYSLDIVLPYVEGVEYDDKQFISSVLKNIKDEVKENKADVGYLLLLSEKQMRQIVEKSRVDAKRKIVFTDE